ncbi:unannotated protein [freshwater metagenome]|uniref:Unannotated protein n=1 Tax=freshwater metagenome TaxID=449393 RepID=A0A6J7LRC3_9ZZZZ
MIDRASKPAMAQSSGPLSGLHIVDISTYVAGPSATMTLAQLGANVVRVDPPGGATDTKRLPLSTDGRSLYWAGLNKCKRSLSVDTRNVRGQRLVQDLITRPGPGRGIVVTNALAFDWLSYESLRSIRPDVIHVQILGRSDGSPAVDYTINPEVGLPWLTGPANSATPVNHVLPAWDLIAGQHAALSVLVAERTRALTGEGQSITVSLADIAASIMGHLGFIADVALNGSERLRDGNHLFGSFGCDFPTSDDKRVMVVALTARHWRSLVDLTGTQAVVEVLQKALGVDFSLEEDRYQHRSLLTALLAPWFLRQPRESVARALDASHVLWGDYRTVNEMVNAPDGLVAKSAVFQLVDQPGIGTYPVPGPVAQSTAWRPGPLQPAPYIGQHTDEVLEEWLAVDEVDDLRSARVIT